VTCPRCGSTALAPDGDCAVCSKPLEADSPTVAPGIANGVPGGVPSGVTGLTSGAPALTVGEKFGSRYHIIRLLGVGGMGAVYQAWDQALEVTVALKIVRPQASPNVEAAEELEKRLKRELLLARQVTHKNVVRIHDLGEINGIKYITMPYVQGSDLATILKRDGRLPVDRALAIAKEVASGLMAAHEAGVVHRDLKPANIMIDGDGHALIMDFGIARSTSFGTAIGMTVAGSIVGTVAYMAPEQARGEAVDQRADIYSFGLILNDLLLGRRHAGQTINDLAELMSRMQLAPPAVRSIDPNIPVAIDALVTKCVQPEPGSRCQSMSEVLADLETLDRGGQPMTAAPPILAFAQTKVVARRATPRAWVLGACLLLVLTVAGWALRARLLSPRPAHLQQGVAGPTISLAILPFRNASGDPALDSLGPSLSEILRTELGQSSQLRTVPSNRLLQVLQDLRIAPDATLAPAEMARVADFTNARSVLWGQFTRFGNAIRIDATLQDLDHEQTVPLNATAPNEESMLTTISQLAESVRQNLARGSPDILSELKSTSWKPSTGSFEAMRSYNDGVGLTRQGKHQEALKSFEAATKQDGNFALGFSALARSYAELGYDSEAAQFSRRAMSLSEALPPQEKYLISANHYLIVNDQQKAIGSYENLVKATPNSAMVQFDLGGLYEQSGAFDQARQYFAKVVELDPKFVDALLALGRVEIKRGNPQGSLTHLNAALTLAIQLEHDTARADILQATGIAYKRMNRQDEALRRYEESLEIKRRLGQKRGMAVSLGEIAQVQEVLGKLRDAEQSYRAALKLQREIGNKSGISATLMNLALLLSENLGRPDEALPLLRESLQLRRDAKNENGEALALNNIGVVYLSKGEYSEALTYFERALDLRQKAKVPNETADTLHNLAEVRSKMGRYDQSLAEYLRALGLRRDSGDRRGAAVESYSIGTIFDYQGRYGAAIKSKEDALKAFRDLKHRDMWLGEILGGYGNSLSLSGRIDDAAKSLEEAISLARELQNPSLIAQTLRFQADRLFYSGDLEGANRLAEQALQAASRASDRSLVLLAQADVAMTAAVMRPSRTLASKLATLAQEADTLGLNALAVDCSIQRADTLLKLGDRVNGRQEVERALAKSEALGLRVLLAKAHYLRAEALRPGDDAEARREYASALRLLEEIKAEDGSHNLLKRADLGAMYADCVRRSRAA
jgi:eukaryotic-like serine/threonine-protein kinase